MLERLYLSRATISLGTVVLISDGDSICRLSLGEHQFVADKYIVIDYKYVPVLSEAVRWLHRYFQGYWDSLPRLSSSVGSAFQRSVWEETSNIPWGGTITYGELANRVSLRTGRLPCAQAVGQALRANPWPFMIPCHRVIARTGFGGYVYGIEIKKALLRHEEKRGIPYF